MVPVVRHGVCNNALRLEWRNSFLGKGIVSFPKNLGSVEALHGGWSQVGFTDISS